MFAFWKSSSVVMALPLVVAALGCDAKPAGSGGSGSGGSGSGSAAVAASMKPAAVAPAVASQAAASEAKPEDPKGVAPQAKQVLADWYAALTAAKSYSADTASNFSVLQAGAEVNAEKETYRVAFERPDRFAVRLTGGTAYTIVNDGKQLYQFNSEKKVYTLGEPLKSLEDLAKSLVLTRTHSQQGLSIVADALAGMPLDKILEQFESIAYVGSEDAGGRKQQHLRAANDGVHYDFWFDADKPFALRRVQPNVMEIAAKNGKEFPPGIELKLAVTFDQVTYDAAVPAEAFDIKPPTDAVQLDEIDDPLGKSLVGKPAPSFEAPLLDGGTFKLADYKGKIVVLDFWATWCPPCVAGLPKLVEYTDKLKDAGVVFFPININEEPSIIKEFLAAKELKTAVVLEQGQDILKAYKVEPVPQTVFIDREGVVQIVHIGIGELEEIPKQLADLVAGKNFAKTKEEKK
ncbi:MAG: redoxin domain-containing protein [Pirellulales bacterium]